MKLTREQVQRRKDRAVQFVRDVLQDRGRAAEIEDESLDDYAARRRITVVNPHRRCTQIIDIPGGNMPSKQELEQRIKDLKQENDELRDQLGEIADIAAPQEEEEEGEGEGENDRGE